MAEVKIKCPECGEVITVSYYTTLRHASTDETLAVKRAIQKHINKEEPKYCWPTMDRVRQNLGLDAGDTSKDGIIASMSSDEVFARCLEWEGIIGWASTIRYWIEEIYSVKLNK